MSNILALVELNSSGSLSSTTPSLIASATKLGTPVAVIVVGPGAAANLAQELGALGAAQVIIAECAQATTVLATPAVAALEAAISSTSPAAVLIPNTINGRRLRLLHGLRIRKALLLLHGCGQP